MDTKKFEKIRVSQMLKAILYKIYYKFCLEQDDKVINQYLVLTYAEIKEMLEKIKVFSSVSLIASQTQIIDGLLYIHANYGMIVSYYADLSKNDLHIEIINAIKNYYIDKRGVEVCVRVDSCNHHHLILAIPVSKYGLKNFSETEYLKMICLLNQQNLKNAKNDRYHQAMKNRQL